MGLIGLKVLRLGYEGGGERVPVPKSIRLANKLLSSTAKCWESRATNQAHWIKVLRLLQTAKENSKMYTQKFPSEVLTNCRY